MDGDFFQFFHNLLKKQTDSKNQRENLNQDNFFLFFGCHNHYPFHFFFFVKQF